VSFEDAVETVRTAVRLGITFFDTAPSYGHGLAEQRLGFALRDVQREDVIVATKVGRLLRPGDPSGSMFRGTPPVVPVFDFSYDGVMRSLAESLGRLGLDRVDVLHIHDPDDHYDEALDGAHRALSYLRAQGVIRAVSAGMNQAGMLVRFAREASFDCFLIAGRYSLLDRSAAETLLPLCLEKGIAVIVGGVFNSGLLAGGVTYDYAPAPAALVSRAREMDAACARHGVPLKAAALQFPLRHAAVTTLLIGARSPVEVEENVRLLALDVPDELWSELGA
jgi:D-threo-aldose 1-dehydrogenase